MIFLKPTDDLLFEFFNKPDQLIRIRPGSPAYVIIFHDVTFFPTVVKIFGIGSFCFTENFWKDCQGPVVLQFMRGSISLGGK